MDEVRGELTIRILASKEIELSQSNKEEIEAGKFKVVESLRDNQSMALPIFVDNRKPADFAFVKLDFAGFPRKYSLHESRHVTIRLDRIAGDELLLRRRSWIEKHRTSV